jgi:hypothetical protein
MPGMAAWSHIAAVIVNVVVRKRKLNEALPL